MASRRALLIAACALAGTVLSGCNPAKRKETPPHRAVVSKTTFSMSTLVDIQVWGPDEGTARRWMEGADDEIRRLSAILTVHEESPLRNVIEHSGEMVEVPPEIGEAVEKALRVAKDSNGHFEPTIGKIVDVWRIGFGGTTVPDKSEVEEALRYVDWRRVRIERRSGKCFVGIGSGQDIDLGGIGKGLIGTKAVEYLRRQGAQRALLNLGGNVALLGRAPENRLWRIGLQHPQRHRDDYFGVVEAADESVITSGAYERNMEVDGKLYGHILSPRTGYPVDTDLSSVTVVDKDGALADAWCTAFFAMGQSAAEAILRSRSDIRAVLLGADMTRVSMSRSLQERVKITDPRMDKVIAL